MPNSVKYSTTGDTLSIRRANFYFGLGDVGKGPSSATTYYNGVIPTTGGYTVYRFNTNETSKISYNSVSDVSQLVTYTNSISGQNFTGASQCLAWYFTQSTYACINRDYPTIPTSGLTFISDIGSSISYPLTGNTSYNMDVTTTNSNVSYLNGPTYVPEYGGGMQFDGVNDTASLLSILNTSAFTWVMIARSPTSTWTGNGFLSNAGSWYIYPLNGQGRVDFFMGSFSVNPFTNLIGNITPSSIVVPHMYVISSNGTNLHKAYVDNGSPISISTTINRTTYSSSLDWGSYSSYLQVVTYVQIYYNRQLSDSEVLSIYNGYAARFDFGVDPDAAAFITAAGITNSTQKTAINQLVLDLKSYSLWTKMSAIYPFVGGTATSNMYNLKDPRDLDEAYRLQFNGGWTHDSNGSTNDGSTGYADTFVEMSSAAIPNRLNHWSSYNRTVQSSFKYTSGLIDGSVRMFGFGGGGSANLVLGLQTFGSVGVNPITGFINGTVTSTSNAVFYRNGSAVITQTPISMSYTGQRFLIGAVNFGGSPFEYSTTNFAFASLGGALTATDAANFYTAVQAFQTTLGRQI